MRLCRSERPAASRVALLLVALGDLLLDVGRDALVGLVERRLAGDRLAEPADHRVEDDAVVDVALQLVGDRRESATPSPKTFSAALACGLRRWIVDALAWQGRDGRARTASADRIPPAPARWRDIPSRARLPSGACVVLMATRPAPPGMPVQSAGPQGFGTATQSKALPIVLSNWRDLPGARHDTSRPGRS